MTFASTPIGRIPRFHGNVAVVAFGSLVAVPIVVSFFPRWVNRWTMPLFAVTSVGVFLTVPDTERVGPLMLIVAIAAVLCFAGEVEVHRGVVALTALVIIGTALLDSGSRGAAIVRAVGSFGVLLAAPVAVWLRDLSAPTGDERRPPLVLLLVLHCVVAAFSSRVLIRQTDLYLVLGAVGAALVVAALLLFVTARPVAVPAAP